MDRNFKLLPAAVITARADGKQAVLEQLAACFAATYGLDEAAVLEALDERERLGSTGFGRSVAIPHARIAGIEGPMVVLIRLDSPVDFAAADGMPVELVFGLLSPTNSGVAHLHALAAISRMVRNDETHEALVGAQDSESLYAVLTNIVSEASNDGSVSEVGRDAA